MKTTQSAPAAVADKDDIGWRHFPELEKLLSSEEPPPLLSRVEKTCRQLDELAKSGSDTDKARAKAAMAAFGRSLDLYRFLLEMRDKTLKQK
jgi:hypothetical protein